MHGSLIPEFCRNASRCAEVISSAIAEFCAVRCTPYANHACETLSSAFDAWPERRKNSFIDKATNGRAFYRSNRVRTV